MKPTVSQQTAKQLAEAGFLPPEVVDVWHFYWAYGYLTTVEYVSNSGNIDLIGPESYSTEFTKELFEQVTIFAPTATDIIRQMPIGTKIQTVILATGENLWECIFDIDDHYDDSRYDECPHEAAAKAFLAWKAGLA